jgi:hypothetical protein
MDSGLTVELHLPMYCTYLQTQSSNKKAQLLYLLNYMMTLKKSLPTFTSFTFQQNTYIHISQVCSYHVDSLLSQPLHKSTTCKQLTQNNAKVCLENFLLPSFILQVNNELSKNHYNILQIYSPPPSPTILAVY